MAEDVLEQLREIESRREEAERQRARHEAAAERAEEELATVKASLKADFGIETYEEGKERLAQLEAALSQDVVAIRDALKVGS